jgi:hypothetical protein
MILVHLISESFCRVKYLRMWSAKFYLRRAWILSISLFSWSIRFYLPAFLLVSFFLFSYNIDSIIFTDWLNKSIILHAKMKAEPPNAYPPRNVYCLCCCTQHLLHICYRSHRRVSVLKRSRVEPTNYFSSPDICCLSLMVDVPFSSRSI